VIDLDAFKETTSLHLDGYRVAVVFFNELGSCGFFRRDDLFPRGDRRNKKLYASVLDCGVKPLRPASLLADYARPLV
jgi:hypothetical protein